MQVIRDYRKHILLALAILLILVGLAYFLLSNSADEPAPRLTAGQSTLVGDEPITRKDLKRWGRLLKLTDNDPKMVNAQLMLWEQLRQYEKLGKIKLEDGDIARFASDIDEKVDTSLASSKELGAARRAEALGFKLDELGSEAFKAPTPEDLYRLYRENLESFKSPEQRTYRAISTLNLKDAQAAARLVRAGRAWYKVGQRYTNDISLRATGGVYFPTSYETADPKIRDFVFDSAKDKIRGPEKIAEQYYVIRVDKIIPARTKPFSKVRDLLSSQFTEAAGSGFFNSPRFKFFQYWKSRTVCARGYKIPACKNGPSFIPQLKNEKPTTIPQ